MNGNEPGDNLVIGQVAANDSTINTDSELEDHLAQVDSEINDALNDLEEKNYAAALESIGSVQEIINSAHAYLSGKVE